MIRLARTLNKIAVEHAGPTTFLHIRAAGTDRMLSRAFATSGHFLIERDPPISIVHA
jgi:hypothetical protein